MPASSLIPTGRRTRLLALSGALLVALTVLLPAWFNGPTSNGSLTGLVNIGQAGEVDDAGRRLHVYPHRIALATARDFQSIVAVVERPDGLYEDVSAEATLVLDEPVARLDGRTLHPARDGGATLSVRYDGLTASVPVEVVDAKADRPISFRLDVMPVFMAAGCNAGACHGSASGQDGFELSLFGYDPAGDHYRLTREFPGRRVNLADPPRSLLVEKALGLVPHTGGQLFDEDSHEYRTLIRWLEAGAPDDDPDIAEPVDIRFFPRRLVLEADGTRQPMTVVARYSDGTTRDVTDLCLYMTSNEASAVIDEAGRVTTGRRGEAFVFARFHTFTAGTQIIVVPKQGETKVEDGESDAFNYIDRHVNAKLDDLRIDPSERCRDEVFLRRVYLDITGTLPTVEEYRAFMADETPDKRAKLVDELLGRKEFVELWVMKWAELLQIRSSREVSYKAALLYHNWLQERIEAGVPINEIAAELIAASGGTFQQPATNYYQIETDAKKLGENVAQVFLGIRLQCAQCHNHPFDRWTMDDYYGWTAFFTQVGRKNAEDPRETIIFNQNRGEVPHPVTDKPRDPKFLGGEQPDVGRRDRRAVVADWLADEDNPYFARNVANLVWAHFFGQGVVEPVDDVRITNPPSNPALLDALAERLVRYDYDFRKLVRDICLSRAYQRSTRPNESNRLDTRNFARQQLRRLRAEVLLDCISQVTDAPDKFKGLPRGARAVQIADGQTTTPFLETFGRARRETVCSCEVNTEPNLSQALHLINGNTINQKIQRGGLIKRLLDDGRTDAEIIEALFIRCYSRTPTADEQARLSRLIADHDDRTHAFEDLLWALLNSREFVFNH